jgi:hypothetical protein
MEGRERHTNPGGRYDSMNCCKVFSLAIAIESIINFDLC